mmetsp:Transcript_18572/g.42924  ORF Transcript_18572/g.42924 Transcript_18572/m.42924 type:complete len:122 (+) Transcript_18572:1110-1475(+)
MRKDEISSGRAKSVTQSPSFFLSTSNGLHLHYNNDTSNVTSISHQLLPISSFSGVLAVEVASNITGPFKVNRQKMKNALQERKKGAGTESCWEFTEQKAFAAGRRGSGSLLEMITHIIATF